jgi:hypothetical protein
MESVYEAFQNVETENRLDHTPVVSPFQSCKMAVKSSRYGCTILRIMEEEINMCVCVCVCVCTRACLRACAPSNEAVSIEKYIAEWGG